MIAALLALQLVQGGLGPLVAVGPGLGPSAEDCRGCHRQIFEAWRGSRHGRAWTNDVFRASFSTEPMRWCVYCHAPLVEQVGLVGHARQIRPGEAPLADEGVNCAACHLRDGKVLTSKLPSRKAEAAHPMRVEPRLGTELCAGCHQFNFPDERATRVRYTDGPMQSTFTEWQASHRRESCAECHLRGHAFPGVELMRDTLTVEVSRPRRDTISIRLASRGAGHRIPTGDPFRRLVVELCAEPGCDEPLAMPAFARSFRRRTDGVEAWQLHRDTTLLPDERVDREVSIPNAPPVVYWRLQYRLVAPSTERLLDRGAASVELFRGVAQVAPSQRR